MTYTVEVIRSDRRSMSLEVRADGRVLVRAPRRTSERKIRAFVEENRAWIAKRLAALAERPPVEKLTEAELTALKKRAKSVFAEKAAFYAARLGVRYGRIAVRCQKSKWGSCSAKGNLNFNCLLLLAPEAVLDYVVVHELCHRIEMNHSPRFWAQVATVLPDYNTRRRWLKTHGGELMAKVYD